MMMTTIEKGRSAPHELLNIAAKARQLASQVSPEWERFRLAGWLTRDSHNVDALCEVILRGAKAGDELSAAYIETPHGFALLQLAITAASDRLWEYLWNEKHPGRVGHASDGEDVALMSVWRKRVREIFSKCHQDAVLAMTPEAYAAKLTKGGSKEDTVEMLLARLSVIREGDTPST
jgi:hypothetical protein